MNKPFEEIEFTPEDIYKELMKSGIEFELNEEYKYLETITPSVEAVEEINRLIEESNKRIKKLFPYDNVDNITIDDIGDWKKE